MLPDGTYDAHGKPKSYKRGYQVGIWNKTQVETWAATNNPQSKPIQWVNQRMTRTTKEFGAWTDKNGNLYLEPCIWIEDLETALTVARALKQIAIWDWAEMDEIRMEEVV